jgi:hypothetical protein
VHAIAFQTAITRIYYELSKVRSSSLVASCVAVVVLSAFHPFARCATSSSLLAFEFLCERGANVRFLASFALVLVEWCPSMLARPSTMGNTDNLSRNLFARCATRSGPPTSSFCVNGLVLCVAEGHPALDIHVHSRRSTRNQFACCDFLDTSLFQSIAYSHLTPCKNTAASKIPGIVRYCHLPLHCEQVGAPSQTISILCNE